MTSLLAASPVARLVAGLMAVMLLASCTSLPESGPVVEAGTATQVDEDRPSDINAAPPVAGAPAVDIVEGFLDAMTASPIRVDIAQQFLTTSAAATWDPEESTITYGALQPPLDEGSRISVPLVGADRLDRGRAWEGSLGEEESTLRFTVARQDNEWRITNPPNALIVPATWFTQRFEQAAVYYFDPTGTILVPELVFVPRGEQLVTTLVAALVDGVTERSQGVVRSFVPADLTSKPVPVSEGVAQVDLDGNAAAPQSRDDVERMFAQLAWTLGQDPAVTGVRVSIGDQSVPTPGGGAVYSVTDALPFDPNVAGASHSIFGLQNGVFGTRNGNELVPVTGILGTGGLRPRFAAADLFGSSAAAVSRAGTSVLLATLSGAASNGPTNGTDGSPDGPDGSPDGGEGGGDLGASSDRAWSRPFNGGVDLLRPAWDFTGRVWLVDRTNRGAVVRYIDPGGQVHRVHVPSVSGQRVTAFLVSRDGSRFAAVVRGNRTDQLLVSRIRVDPGGTVRRMSEPQRLAPDAGLVARIRAIGWTSPTLITVASPVVAGRLYEVRSLSVDGSPAPRGAVATTVQGAVVGLATSPVANDPAFAITPTTLIDLEGGSYGFLGDPITSLGYAG